MMDNETYGKICHLDELSNDLKNSFLNPEFSGVHFIVEGRQFAVHKEILASRSFYFKSLLFGGFKEENQKEIELKDTNPDAFHSILQYLYTGQLDLSTLEINIILEIMRSSHEWQLSGLMKSVSKYIIGLNVNLNNFFTFLDFSVSLDFTELLQKVCSFYDADTEKILDDPTFKDLSFKSISELLKRDSTHEHEEKVFNAIALWVKDVEVDESNLILDQIKLPLLTPAFLLKNVKESGLFSIEKVVEVSLTILEAKNWNSSYKTILNKNMATLENEAKLLKGQGDHALKGDRSNENLTYHTSQEPNDCILISLNEIYILDHIQFRLHENNKEFKYKLEVSHDEKKWKIIADNSHNYCKSWQKFIFKERPIKFIKITGFECIYNNRHKDNNPLYIWFIEASLLRNPSVASSKRTSI